MFERFTQKARQSVVLAQEEARALGHGYVGTEHLLLGLLREPTSIGARSLRSLRVDLAGVRDDVVRLVGRGEGAPEGHIPFTPRAKKVLELSLREALTLGHNYIGTEHVLLGVVREGEGLAAQVLVGRGAGLERVRAAVMAELKGAGVGGRADQPARTPAAEEVLQLAEELAGGGPVGSHHLLEALARSGDSAAGRALAAMGVAGDAVASALDEVAIEQTTDVTPVEAAARRLRIELAGDEVHLVLADTVTVDGVRRLTERLGGPVRGDDPAVGSLARLWRGVADELDALDRRLNPPADAGPARAGALRDAVLSRLVRRRKD